MELDGQDKLCTFDAEDLRRKENVKYLLRIDDASKDAKDVVLLAAGRGGYCGLLPMDHFPADVLIDTSAQGVYFRRLVSIELKPLNPASPELWKLWFICQIYQDTCSECLSTATFLL